MSAARELAESEIQLIKEIESSRVDKSDNGLTVPSLKAKNSSNNMNKKSTRMANVTLMFLQLAISITVLLKLY